MRDSRGQLSLSTVEAGIGVLFILAVTMGFAMGVPSPNASEPQLNAYASDTATVLVNGRPRHQGATRLTEVLQSNRSFAREHAALRRRVDRILPDNLLFRVRTPYGTVGYRKPAGVTVGVATVATTRGKLTIWVWYA